MKFDPVHNPVKGKLYRIKLWAGSNSEGSRSLWKTSVAALMGGEEYKIGTVYSDELVMFIEQDNNDSLQLLVSDAVGWVNGATLLEAE